MGCIGLRKIVYIRILIVVRVERKCCLGGGYPFLMMVKFFKESIMIHSRVGLAMSFRLMEILL